jgi:predicted permease
MELLRLFGDNLLPVFLTAGGGWVLAGALRPDPRPLAQVGLYVLAPCLILEVILRNAVPPSALLRMLGFAFECLALPGALAFGFARWRGWSRTRTSAIVLCTLLTNAGNYGMSVSLLAFGERALAQASLFFLASAIVSYTAGVFVASMGRTGLRESLVGLLRMPTMWAVALAFAMSATGVRLPGPLASSVHLLSSACSCAAPGCRARCGRCWPRPCCAWAAGRPRDCCWLHSSGSRASRARRGCCRPACRPR